MDFSPLGKVQFLYRIFLEPWDHLEVVVECVVAPREIMQERSNPLARSFTTNHLGVLGMYCTICI